jgi:hypothetical protein
MNQHGPGFRKRLSPLVKALRWFFSVTRSYAKVRLSPDQAWSGADSRNAPSGSDLARNPSGSQPRAQRTRYGLGDSMAQRGTSGDRSGNGALESLSEAIPTCGLRGAERFSAAAKPAIAFRRIAPLPDGLPLPGGLYEWFDSDWSDVFVACPLKWESEHRPLRSWMSLQNACFGRSGSHIFHLSSRGKRRTWRWNSLSLGARTPRTDVNLTSDCKERRSV